MDESSCVFEIIHQTIHCSENKLKAKDLCETAGVSRSGYYAWLRASTARDRREEEDHRDFDIILNVYKKRGYSKGARGIHMDLLHEDPPVIMNVKKIRRLMKKYKLECPLRKLNPHKQLARDMKTENVAENLLRREFEKYGPRMVLLTDITYLRYSDRFAYLSTIIDAYTKQILSYVVSSSLEVDFVLETIEKLIAEHGISLHAETIIHSDQGSHYTSHKFIELVYNKELRRSMSRKGNCWDNAPQESFYGHMKDHIKDQLKNASSFDEVHRIVDDYIDYYNNERYQWDLAKLSPNEFYKFVTTGIYPLDISHPPAAPVIEKKPWELGEKKTSEETENNNKKDT
ncbi:MAG: IS3 family transposase [Phascolarctobacterium sp.]|nr:IS3 family transposase [Phascolarctobacterium sp.]